MSSIIIIIVYPSFGGNENTILWDSLIVMGALVGIFQFIRVYNLAPDLAQKITFLILGIGIGVAGLGINILMILLTQETTLLRQIEPIVGWLLVIVSFTSIPEKIRTSEFKLTPSSA